MHWPKTGATHYFIKLGLPDKGRIGCLKFVLYFIHEQKDVLDLTADFHVL